MRAIIPTALLLFVAITGVANAADQNELQSPPRHASVQLGELLDAVSQTSGKEFLVYQRIPAEVVTGPARVRDVTYPQLLSILRNNDLAAVTMDGIVNIVPVSTARMYPLPMIENDDERVPDDAWVTRVIRANNAYLPKLVPIVRPLVPQAGHLAADPLSNTMIVIAHYGVTRQVASLVQTFDRHTPKQGQGRD